MKKIIVACGAGIATSTVVIQKLKAEFEKRNLIKEITFMQCTVAELIRKIEGYDMIITTSQFSKDVDIPVISGLPFITGLGKDKLMDEIISRLEM